MLAERLASLACLQQASTSIAVSVQVASLGKVTSQHFGLILGGSQRIVFQGPGDASVKRASRSRKKVP